MLVVTVIASLLVMVVATANLPTDQATVQVTLRQGAITGSREEAINGRVYYSFKSIPYAKPPVGPLRFKVRGGPVTVTNCSPGCKTLPTSFGRTPPTMVSLLFPQNPEPANPWSGVRNGSLPIPKCPQTSILILKRHPIEGQEDCLYLNVFTPHVR